MELTVNGEARQMACDGHETLLTALRDRLQLTGAKLGCGRGECGACTVLIDDRLAYACLTLARSCEGQHITTVEGLGSATGLHPIQQAFIEHDAVQCGYCTPGQLVAAVALLARGGSLSSAGIAAGMSGNLCRCGTYPGIRRAVQMVAEAATAAVLPAEAS